MAGSRRAVPPPEPPDDPFRRRLLVPIAVLVAVLALGTGARAVWTGDTAPFLAAMGPLMLLCGYLFGATLIRKPGSGA